MQTNRMLFVHVSTSTITFFHCRTVRSFVRAWRFFFSPLIFLTLPLFLQAGVLASSLSIRNHLEQILTSWQIFSGNQSEGGEDKTPCSQLSFHA